MAKLTDLAWARHAVAAYLRERELAEWRARFASLENTFVAQPATDSPPPPLRSLRLRLGSKKNLWEISALAPVFPPPLPSPAPSPSSPLSPSSAPLPPRFETLSATELRELLGAAEHFALTLEPASASFAAILRAHQATSGRTTLKLTDAYDCTFLARLFNHPLARTCIVDEAGRPITRDPRRLVWQFHDHPTDPTLTCAQLGFADGTPAPTPLLHLPAQPDLYLHDATLFTGLPPPRAHASPADVAAPVPVPRAALALPEAGRFASRAGVILPNDTTGRFRHETLRPRLRARLDPRRPAGTDTHSPSDDVMLVELAALAADVARTLQPDVEEKQLRLTLATAPLTIEADAPLLRQALFNLLLNAAQAVAPGGHIDVRWSTTAGGSAVLEIADDGPGVPPGERQAIFKPYVTMRPKGVGLGLAIVHQIVAAHRWELICTSNNPRGALFRLSHLRVVSSPPPATA